jgi:hypothetical protein
MRLLEAYRRVERLLATELGIRPQPDLTELHTRMPRGESTQTASAHR